MSVDWRRLSREAQLRAEGDDIQVDLPGERTQRIRVAVDQGGRGFALTSRIAPPRIVRQLMPDLLTRIGEQNRLSELVGYRIDKQDRLIGECWVPMAGVSVGEWAFHVRTLAEACDRLEFVLTGRDLA